MITNDTVIVGVDPDLTLEEFIAIQETEGSVALVEAKECYAAIIKARISVAFFLAIFKMESQFGTLGICYKYNTHSPGNTRSTITLKGSPVVTPQGTYMAYSRWLYGTEDLVTRFNAPDYVYAKNGLITIGQIMPVFAPSTDNNRPDIYINNILTWMGKWIGGGSSMDLDYYNLNIIDKTGQLVYDGKTGSRGGYAIKELVLHETAGPSDSKNATGALATQLDNNTLNWFLKVDNQLSIHYFIGGENTGAPVYRCCPENLMAYHAIGNKGVAAGGSVDNHISIGIERMGQPNDGPVGPKQTAALCKLALDICKRNGLTTDQIVSHASIQPDKRDGNTLLAIVKKFVSDNLGVNHVDNTEPSKPAVRTFPTGKSLAHGFLDFYDRLAQAGPNLELLTLGYPVTNEFDLPLGGQTKTVQLFERSSLIYDSVTPSPWDIHTATISELVQIVQIAKDRGLLN